jgi:L-erythrulose 1-phosphate isomerase
VERGVDGRVKDLQGTSSRSFFDDPRPIVGAGLKMFLGHRQTLDYLTALGAHGDVWDDVRAFVLPTVTGLEAASRLLAGTEVRYGAQDAHGEAYGAFTGGVSTRTLAELGCTFLEVGHVERSRWFGESWEDACRKTAAAVAAGLVPLVCVGEQRAVDARRAVAEVETQLTEMLDSAGGSPIVVAYEPCWAIGAADVAETQHVAVVVDRIREVMAGYAGSSAVIYGGSVSADRVSGLMASAIDGVFVGRAAATAPGFVEIARRVAGARTEGCSARPAASQ